MVQTSGSLETTQYYFAPAALGHDGFVMAMRVKNVGVAPITGISAFTIHNFHLGYGRYGAIADLETQDIAANGETIDFDGSPGHADFLERAFAGVVVARPLGAVAHHGTSNPTSAIKVYDVVNNGGTTDLPDLNGPGTTADDSVSAYQWNVGSLMPGAEAWVGVAFAHSGDPFAGAKVQTWLDAYVGNKGAQQLVNDEIASWAALQASVTVPAGASADEETLLRQSAVTLTMAQVQEQTTYLREHLSNDSDARYTKFGTTAGGPPATLPADVVHDGKGAMLACQRGAGSVHIGVRRSRLTSTAERNPPWTLAIPSPS
jgi:hypothetical protein